MIESGANTTRRVTRASQRQLRGASRGKGRQAGAPAVNIFDDPFGELTTQLRETAAHCPASAQLPQRALAVLYIDLNGFKSMNDTHGHHTGDHLLQIVAARLKHSMRAEDMVCRLGGDEFGCLLTGLANRRQISQVAVKVFDVLAAPLRIGDVTLAVPPSIGIAVAPGDGATSEDLLHRADAAMYHAKHYRTRYTFFREAFPKGMIPGNGVHRDHLSSAPASPAE